MTTRKKVAQYGAYLINSIIFFIFVLILLFILYCINGSLEEFPTQDDHEKVRIVAVWAMCCFSILEIILGIISIKLRSVYKK